MINREDLDKLIHLNGTTENWWKPDLFIKNILPLFPNELEILSNPPTEDCNYNCFAYALRYSDDMEIIKDCGGFIYDTFYLKLREFGELKPTQEIKDGTLIIYEDKINYPDLVTHMGVLENGKVISKWSWGPLVRHEIMDVPLSYGDDVSFLEPISKEYAKELYWKYKQFNVARPKEE